MRRKAWAAELIARRDQRIAAAAPAAAGTVAAAAGTAAAGGQPGEGGEPEAKAKGGVRL